jgi:hypothetical protein
MEAED